MHTELIPELVRRSNKYTEVGMISKLGVKVKFEYFVQTTKELKHSSIDTEVFGSLLKAVTWSTKFSHPS